MPRLLVGRRGMVEPRESTRPSWLCTACHETVQPCSLVMYENLNFKTVIEDSAGPSDLMFNSASEAFFPLMIPRVRGIKFGIHGFSRMSQDQRRHSVCSGIQLLSQLYSLIAWHQGLESSQGVCDGAGSTSQPGEYEKIGRVPLTGILAKGVDSHEEFARECSAGF